MSSLQYQYAYKMSLETQVLGDIEISRASCIYDIGIFWFDNAILPATCKNRTEVVKYKLPDSSGTMFSTCILQ